MNDGFDEWRPARRGEGGHMRGGGEGLLPGEFGGYFQTPRMKKKKKIKITTI